MRIGHRLRNVVRGQVSVLIAAVLAVVSLAPQSGASAATLKTKTKWTETVLYSFCTGGGCTAGYYPLGGLIADAAGHLYGTTSQGGAGASGTVFELTP